jgi:hypothetical protein
MGRPGRRRSTSMSLRRRRHVSVQPRCVRPKRARRGRCSPATALRHVVEDPIPHATSFVPIVTGIILGTPHAAPQLRKTFDEDAGGRTQPTTQSTAGYRANDHDVQLAHGGARARSDRRDGVRRHDAHAARAALREESAVGLRDGLRHASRARVDVHSRRHDVGDGEAARLSRAAASSAASTCRGSPDAARHGSAPRDGARAREPRVCYTSTSRARRRSGAAACGGSIPGRTARESDAGELAQRGSGRRAHAGVRRRRSHRLRTSTISRVRISTRQGSPTITSGGCVGQSIRHSVKRGAAHILVRCSRSSYRRSPARGYHTNGVADLPARQCRAGFAAFPLLHVRASCFPT